MTEMYKIKDSDELEGIMMDSQNNTNIYPPQVNLLSFLSPKILKRRNAVNEDEIRKALAHLNIGVASNNNVPSGQAMIAV